MIESFRAGVRHIVAGESRELTMRQMAILLEVVLSQRPQTIRGMAALFDIPKPSVVRAVDALDETGFGFVRREREGDDRRSVLVLPTPAGQAYVHKLTAALLAPRSVAA